MVLGKFRRLHSRQLCTRRCQHLDKGKPPWSGRAALHACEPSQHHQRRHVIDGLLEHALHEILAEPSTGDRACLHYGRGAASIRMSTSLIESAPCALQVSSCRQKVDKLHEQLQCAQAAMPKNKPATPRAQEHMAHLKMLHEHAQQELAALQEPVSLFGAAPYIAIWDSHLTPGAEGCPMLRRIDFPPEGTPPVSSRSAARRRRCFR